MREILRRARRVRRGRLTAVGASSTASAVLTAGGAVTGGARTGALTWATFSMATAAAAATPARARSSTEGAGVESELGVGHTGAESASDVPACGVANGAGAWFSEPALGRWSSPAEKVDRDVTRVSSSVGVGVPGSDGDGTGVGVTLRGAVPAGLGARGAPVRGLVLLGRRTTVGSGSAGTAGPLVGAGSWEAAAVGAAWSCDHRSLSGFASLTVGHLRTVCRLQPGQRYRREHQGPKRLHRRWRSS